MDVVAMNMEDFPMENAWSEMSEVIKTQANTKTKHPCIKIKEWVKTD